MSDVITNPDSTAADLAAARRLLAADQEERVQACVAEVEEVLARHGMRLHIATPTVAVVPQ